MEEGGRNFSAHAQYLYLGQGLFTDRDLWLILALDPRGFVIIHSFTRYLGNSLRFWPLPASKERGEIAHWSGRKTRPEIGLPLKHSAGNLS